MAEFRMPSLGADMTEGTIVAWNRKPGDAVKRGDIVAVVGTEKADIEIEIYETGVLDRILVEPGEKVPVGTVLATVRVDGEEAAMPAAAAAATAVAAPSSPARVDKLPPAAGHTPPAARVRASPLARRLAEQLGVDLSTVEGTGADGVIHRDDVERAAAQAREERVEPVPSAGPVSPVEPVPPVEPGPPVEPLPPAAAAPPAPPPPTAAPKRRTGEDRIGMRRAIAAAMSRANREIPHYYLEKRIDMSKTQRWLEATNEQRSIKDRILPVVPVLKAVALALNDVPELNGYWIDDQLQMQEAVNVGFAISLRRGGLIAPAIHDTDLKSVDELMDAVRDLITRTRAGRLRGSELTNATITVTNLGDLGVEKVFGVIYPPQVALVGIGKVTELPWAEDGMLGIRPVLTATLAADHRASDGRRGAQFLEALNRKLQEPETL